VSSSQFPGPEHGQPWYGEPTYPYSVQPIPPPGQHPSEPTSSSRAGRWLALIVAVVAALGVGGYFLFPGDSGSSPLASLGGVATAPATSPELTIPSITIPPIQVPGLSNPPVQIPTIPGGGPSGPFGSVNPCDFATSPEQAAITYVGLAEIGETALAQNCVYRHAVPRSVTAGIARPGAIYSPAGANGATIEFITIDGSSKLDVSAMRKGDGKYWVTRVEEH
jgi:hypothetical protein